MSKVLKAAGLATLFLLSACSTTRDRWDRKFASESDANQTKGDITIMQTGLDVTPTEVVEYVKITNHGEHPIKFGKDQPRVVFTDGAGHQHKLREPSNIKEGVEILPGDTWNGIARFETPQHRGNTGTWKFAYVEFPIGDTQLGSVAHTTAFTFAMQVQAYIDTISGETVKQSVVRPEELGE